MSAYFQRFAEILKRNAIPIIYTSTALVLICISVVNHEIWLDESQHYLLAKNSSTFGDLLTSMQYESHPPLWNFLLKLLHINSVSQLQFLHIGIAGLIMILISFFSPYSQWVKICMVYSYFFSFEYSEIARNYGLSIFFLLLATCLYTYKKKHILLISFLLGLAALTHIYAGLISGLIFVYFIYSRKISAYSLNSILASSFLLVACFAMAIYTSWPQPDHFLYHYHQSSLVSVDRIASSISLPFKVFLHFPDITSDNWWNTNLFFPQSKIGGSILALVVWILPLLYFIHSKKIMLLYLLGSISLTLLLALTPMPLSLRHGGFFIVLFFICLWIDQSEGKQLIQSKRLRLLKNSLAVIFFAVQVSAAFVTHIYEWNNPFSNGKSVAGYFQSRGIEGDQVCVYPHYSGPAVSAYMNQDIFYSERNVEGSFANWSIKNFEIPIDTMLLRCYRRQELTGKEMFIASSVPLDSATSEFTVKEIISFDGACVQAENYKVYTIGKR